MNAKALQHRQGYAWLSQPTSRTLTITLPADVYGRVDKAASAAGHTAAEAIEELVAMVSTGAFKLLRR